MTYDLALISVVIGAGYWGVFFLRRRPHGSATFGLMQIAAAALAGLGLLGRRTDEDALGVAGAIGVGAGACLLIVGPLVRVLARRLAAWERPRIAARLFDLAELLAPGSGVAEERALVRAMTEVREGRIEQTVDALTAARGGSPPDAQLAIDERIAMLYLTAYRWAEATDYAEHHLFGSAQAAPPVNDGGSLRRALGMAPPVWVELLGAYGRLGDLDRAGRMLVRLEDVCAGRDDAAVWIHRARVMFLALAGRADAVRALVAPRQARHMSRAARTYWLAVALEHAGERAGAIDAYRAARSRSRGRPRELMEEALVGLTAGTLGAPVTIPAEAREVIARIEAAPLPPPIRIQTRPRPRATWLLTGALLAVSGVAIAAVGDITDVGVLVRSGALVHGMVGDGEWWRLVACVFVHAGVFHLVLNATGLVMIGRIAEELFGSARLIAIFAISGLAGAVASYLASPAGVTVGASGAVFGLLGALVAELAWHRQRYIAVWKQGMWGGLVVVTVGQLGFGLLYPMIDQWAHVAGLVAGALGGIALSRHTRWTRLAGWASGAIAVGFAALAVIAGVLTVATPMADSLAPSGLVRRQVGELAISVPPSWQVEVDGKTLVVRQSDNLIAVALGREPVIDPAKQIEAWSIGLQRELKDELGDLVIAHQHLIALPPGWQGVELEAAPEDQMGEHQRIRVISCGRVFAGQVVFIAIQVPETIARDAPELFARLLASVGPT